MRFNFTSALFIPLSVVNMLSAINFNHNLWFKACKINNETIDRMLASEFHAQLTLTYGSPELVLSIGHFGTQTPRALGLPRLYSLHSTPILTFPLSGGRD